MDEDKWFFMLLAVVIVCNSAICIAGMLSK